MNIDEKNTLELSNNFNIKLEINDNELENKSNNLFQLFINPQILSKIIDYSDIEILRLRLVHSQINETFLKINMFHTDVKHT